MPCLIPIDSKTSISSKNSFEFGNHAKDNLDESSNHFAKKLIPLAFELDLFEAYLGLWIVTEMPKSLSTQIRLKAIVVLSMQLTVFEHAHDHLAGLFFGSVSAFAAWQAGHMAPVTGFHTRGFLA